MFKPMIVRSANGYDPDEASRAVVVDTRFDDDGVEVPELVQQHFKDECDINEIVRRFGITGQLPEVRMPLSGDFTGVSDFHSAMNMVRQAEEEFMKLPALVREKFDNDPGKLMAFVDDASNRDAAIELGLIPRPPERTRDVVQAVDELAAVLKPKT